MNAQATQLDHLNATVEQILRNWTVIVDYDVELCFHFAPDEPNVSKDKITGYEISHSLVSGFGELTISNDGKIEERIDYAVIDTSVIITASMKVRFPKPLHDIFAKHCASEIFEADLDHIGLVAVLEFDHGYQFSIMSYLSKVVRQLQLDAFTETLLRPNIASLTAKLQPYLHWFDYAAALADDIVDETRRVQLIDDIELVLRYLSCGGDLNFAKMTSLCDVAGNLQPVRNLILTRMPGLAA